MLKAFLSVGVAALMVTAAPATAQSAATAKLKNIVLVHGAWADGGTWQGVADRLRRDGYKVSVVQNSTATLTGDVDYAKRAIAAIGGEVLLVGHSYGGAVITEAGNDQAVKALVYVAAFEPDRGENVQQLATRKVPGATPPPILPPVDGFILLDQAKFPQAFAQDVDPKLAAFMALSQVPWGVAAATTPIASPAWKNKPAWAVVTTQDRMIPPATQEMMVKRSKAVVTRIPADHAVYVSNPDAVTKVIEKAAHGTR